MKQKNKASVLLLVLIVGAVTALVAGSIASMISTQSKLAVRKELKVKSAAAAESASDYAYSILVNKVTTVGNLSIPEIPSTGGRVLALPSAPAAFLSGSPALTRAGRTTSTISATEIRVGAASASISRYIDARDPANAGDPNRGQRIWETTVPIYAKATAVSGTTSITSYVRKRVSLRQVPMFQHAIFFQGQLQLHRGWLVVGPVHTNSMLMINAQNGDTTRYSGSVSTAAEFFRGTTIDMGGWGADAYGYNPTDINGNLIQSAVSIATTGDQRISVYKEEQTVNGSPVYVTDFLRANFDSRLTDWPNLSSQTFKGNLEDKSHSVPTFTPQGSFGYRQDVASTTTVNEFSNGTYSLIEPLLPVGHAGRKSASNRETKLAAKAGLILRVERNMNFTPAGTAPTGGWNAGNEWRATNRNERFVVRGYKYSTRPTSVQEPVLTPVRLPDAMLGEANATITGVNSGRPFAELYIATGPGRGTGNATDDASNVVTSGLHDSRLGRGVEPFTLDMARLKRVMEGTDTDASASAFRSDFAPTGANADWNGVIYFELPTSLTVDSSAPENTTAVAGASSAIRTRPFVYGQPERRHPDRASEADNLNRVNRTDNIVPIAPELRRYPTTDSSLNLASGIDLKEAVWAIPALQVINAGRLPNPTGSRGFTLATNAPVYMVGSYNSDGNVSTGSNLTSNSPKAYSFSETGEVPAAIFSDSLTLLSSDWAGDRANSFRGANNSASSRPAGNRIEISAAIATGEYPVFEFFTRALQDFGSLYHTSLPPILIKGSMIGMFKSEIQHVKQAYARNRNLQIEDYWNSHGAFAIPSVRYHQNLADGIFPPGVPNALIFRPQDFVLMRQAMPADRAMLTGVGFP